MVKKRVFYTSKEAAEYLGISLSALAEKCCRGEITYYKPGRDRQFHQEDMDAFLEESKIEKVR